MVVNCEQCLLMSSLLRSGSINVQQRRVMHLFLIVYHHKLIHHLADMGSEISFSIKSWFRSLHPIDILDGVSNIFTKSSLMHPLMIGRSDVEPVSL